MARPSREVGYEELLVAIARLKAAKPEDVDFLNGLEQQILGRLTQGGATPAAPTPPGAAGAPSPAPEAGGYTPPPTPVPGVFPGGGSPDELRRLLAGR